jgi:hypothetical protein
MTPRWLRIVLWSAIMILPGTVFWAALMIAFEQRQRRARLLLAAG